jgi:serine/threonine-protein kinase
MNLDEPFTLGRDVLLIPCAELSDDVRARISFEAGDFTLSRRHGRALIQVIDGETAALLERFREPRRVLDAILENCRAFGNDPEAMFDELLPHLGAFVRSRVLVQGGSSQEQEIRPQYESGAAIGGWKIVRCASLVEDSEIYQLRRGENVAALKIARKSTAAMEPPMENEADILRRLDGTGIAPGLIDAGRHEERPYLIIDWIPGVDAAVAAQQRRHDRASLIDLCASIAAAYAALHAHGVLHGDVHPRNVFIGDRITLIDFGHARVMGRAPAAGRAGVPYYMEPELIAARRRGTSVPASAAGEQYGLAVLLYALITGQHYLDFRYERAEMHSQIENDPPLTFESCGAAPWPEVERILGRALEKDPQRRYGSIADFAARLAEARDATVRVSLATTVSAQADALLEETLRSFRPGGEMFVAGYPTPPTASINYGCAGAAVGLQRIAQVRGDAELLALADDWKSRAVALIGSGDTAYYDDEGRLPREVLRDVTPYHTESGIHAAAAMIAAATSDSPAKRASIREFLRASRRPCDEIDLVLGRSGSLLVAAMLLPLTEDVPDAAEELRAFGAETMSGIWNEIDAQPAIGQATKMRYLGIAHGWAGYFYASMRWCAVSGDALPARLPGRLREYAALKTRNGRGAYWRRTVDPDVQPFMPSWCNGSAGQVFAFTLAHRLLGDQEWLRLAELSAWDNWDAPRQSSTLCCGTAGRAYALLNLYKHTGAAEWLSRARLLANHAAAAAKATSQRTNSLWKGELGVAVLIADLASPENARMPFFE